MLIVKMRNSVEEFEASYTLVAILGPIVYHMNARLNVFTAASNELQEQQKPSEGYESCTLRFASWSACSKAQLRSRPHKIMRNGVLCCTGLNYLLLCWNMDQFLSDVFV